MTTRWVCPACGSDEVEGLAWITLNTEEIVSWVESSEHWCPECEEHFKHVCQVDEKGRCLMHDQPQTCCRDENRPAKGAEP
jgi:hypothetical protein